MRFPIIGIFGSKSPSAEIIVCTISKSCGKGTFGQRTTSFTAQACEGCPKLGKHEQPRNGAGSSLAVAWVVQACEKKLLFSRTKRVVA